MSSRLVPRSGQSVDQLMLQFAELIRRGWTHNDLSLLAGGNVLRILNGAEAVAAQMAEDGKKPSMAVYDKRTDLNPKPFPPKH
jgi:membrane dipeptidase